MAYITVLWLEFWPTFLERMPLGFKQRYGLDQLQAFLKRYMYVLVAVAIIAFVLLQQGSVCRADPGGVPDGVNCTAF